MALLAPTEPLDFAQVVERWPTVRQSWASSFDDCGLSTYFDLRYAQGWSTTPQARGTIFHRTAAEILRTMQRQGHQTIPISEALQILIEACQQLNVATSEIVRVPMSQMPELRMAVMKFARDNAFSTDKLVAVEEKLTAVVRYTGPDGAMRARTITGTLDALLFAPPDGAVVLDWKDSWGMPPEPKEQESKGYDDEELKGLGYHGYFQQRWYGALVLLNYRNVNAVTLREFYPRFTKVRKATLHRHQLDSVMEEIGVLVSNLDAALESGAPNLRPRPDGSIDIEALGWWKPQPGKHCGFCTRPTACPIEEDVRVAAGGSITNERSAATWAARLQIAERIKKAATEGLKGWVETSGAPVPVRWAKGRRVIGWFQTKRGRRFGFYTPDDSDRGGHADVDTQLKEAMRQSTERARAERDTIRPRKRSTPRKVKT